MFISEFQQVKYSSCVRLDGDNYCQKGSNDSEYDKDYRLFCGYYTPNPADNRVDMQNKNLLKSHRKAQSLQYQLHGHHNIQQDQIKPGYS